jgi:hypothetical protein
LVLSSNHCFLGKISAIVGGGAFVMVRSRGHQQGVIFEFILIGNYVKVSAVDTRSGTEVSIVGDPRRGEAALQRIALRKLETVMKKSAESGGRGRLV